MSKKVVTGKGDLDDKTFIRYFVRPLCSNRSNKKKKRKKNHTEMCLRTEKLQ